MKRQYRLRHLASRPIQVMFAHTPGKWKSSGTHDMAEAVLWADTQLKGEGSISKHQLTLKEFAAGFFSSSDPHRWRVRKERKNKFHKETFYTSHQSRLDRYIIPALGGRLLTSLNDLIIDDWFIDLKSPLRSEISDNTKNKILGTLCIVLEEARRQRLIKLNPTDKVEPITERSQKRLPFCTADLLAMFPSKDTELLRIWGSRMWASYFLVMRDTGFRPGEVAALQVKNISFKLSGIYSTRSVDFRTRQIQESIKTTKKGQPYKVGVLTEQTIESLKSLVLESDLHNDDFLFRINDNLIVPDVANKHLKGSLKKAGVERLGRTQYSLRHSFDTALAGNVENKVLMELMAHTSLRPEYDHRTPEMILEQLQPVRAILEDRIKQR